jgi:hypothetical protein
MYSRETTRNLAMLLIQMSHDSINVLSCDNDADSDSNVSRDGIQFDEED